MKHLAGSVDGFCPRILADDETEKFFIVGKLVPIYKQLEMRFQCGETAVEISREVIMEAAQKLVAKELAGREI